MYEISTVADSWWRPGHGCQVKNKNKKLKGNLGTGSLKWKILGHVSLNGKGKCYRGDDSGTWKNLLWIFFSKKT